MQVRLAFDALLGERQESVSLVVGTIVLISWWLIWRLWRFTVLPQMYPNDPQELPYWIPSKSFDVWFFLLLLLLCFCIVLLDGKHVC